MILSTAPCRDAETLDLRVTLMTRRTVGGIRNGAHWLRLLHD
jgi:hypothetical protein